MRAQKITSKIAKPGNNLSKAWIKKCDLTLVDTEFKLDTLVKDLENCEVFSLDTETSGLDTFTDQIAGISISTREDVGYYISLNHQDSINLPESLVTSKLKAVLASKKCIYYNAAFDRLMIQRIGIDTPDFEDVMLLLYHFDTEKFKAKGLKDMSKVFLGREMIEFTDLFDKDELYGKRRKKLNPVITGKSAAHCLEYACCDAINTLQLYLQNRDKLPKRIESVYKLDTAFIDYVMDMTKTGYHIDVEYLTHIRGRLLTLIDTIQDKMDSLAGFSVNPYASASVWKALNGHGVEAQKFTATGKPAFDEKTMLSIDHPIAKYTLQLKSMKKMVSDFVDKLLRGQHPITKKCHSNYTYSHTATGRLSAKAFAKVWGINIQQAAKEIIKDQNSEFYNEFKGESMRKGIIAPPGYFHAKFDISGAELRIAAHFSKEPIWMKAFKENRDPHQDLADQMNARFPGKNFSRSQAKNAQFNLLYAFYHSTFARNNDISMDEGKEIYDAFFNTMKNYNAWREYYKKLSRKQGYSETHYGRRRQLGSYGKAGELFKTIPWKIPYRDMTEAERDMIRKFNMFTAQGDREAINHRVQGTCLDILKKAAIKIRKHFIGTGQWMGEVIPEMCVHDELNFVIKGELVDGKPNEEGMKNLRTIHNYITQRPENFIIDIASDAEVGVNWKELHKIEL